MDVQYTSIDNEKARRQNRQPEASEPEGQSAEVVSLADWTDETLTGLAPHAPELTGTIIVFREVKH
jgi:hypothetical protein